MRLRFIDGYEFNTETKRGACEALWHSMKFNMYKTLDEWIVANAEVMSNAGKVKLRTISPEDHFDDMVSAGLIEVISEK